MRKASRETSADLIKHNQGLVYKLAMKTHSRLPVRVELDDLVGYGMIGLTEAAANFDPLQGVHFSTYAYPRIRGAIYDGLAKVSWMSRARYRQLVNNQKNADAQSGDEGRVKYALPGLNPLSLGEGEMAPQDQESTPPTKLLEKELISKLTLVIDDLPPQQKGLIVGVYFDGKTMQQVALQLGISKSWASRLHSSTLTELAEKLDRFC